MGKKIAIVTGGSRGIGKAIAEELADLGYDLLLIAKNEERLKRAAEDITKACNVKIEILSCDLSNTKNIDSLEEFCKSKQIMPDVLVNNAGIWASASTEESTLKDYDEIMNTNTKGMFYLTQKLLPFLKKGNGKRIIIVSSAWAQDYYLPKRKEESTVYAMSKWALRGWGRMLREELRKFNIGITMIYPGPVFTDEWEGTSASKDKFIAPKDIGTIIRAIVGMSPGASIDEISINTMVKDVRYD